MEEARHPYSSYAAIAGTFLGGLTLAAAVSRALDREPQSLSTLDFFTLSAATFKASRTITHDRVTSFLREPFVEGDAYDGDDQAPAGVGMQRAIGELVTCTRCVGVWVAAGLGTAQIVTPRLRRLLTWSVAASAANDFLQASFVALNNKSEALSERD